MSEPQTPSTGSRPSESRAPNPSALRGVSGAPVAAGDDGPVRPNVAVSQCLGFAAVRYDGEVLESRFVEALRDVVNFVQVCPEVGMGLGVPRDPIRIEVVDGERRLVQPSTERDLTDRMRDFSGDFLRGLEHVDGFILKSRSPSCGITDTKIHEEGGGSEATGRGSGLFAEAVRARLPWAALQDERRLTRPRHRHHFLTRLWALARLRRVEAAGRMEALARYHARYEPLLTAYRKDPVRRLERLASKAGGRPFDEVVAEYREALGEAMARPPREEYAVDERRRAFEPYPRTLLPLASSGGARLG